MRNTRTFLIAAAVAASLVLTACGNDSDSDSSHHASAAASPSSSSSAPAHNDQDMAFAQGMIPHHRQALEMAGLAADRASSAQVKDLAARIEKAQDPEINTMTGWLKSWGMGMSMDMSSPMPGMMGDKDMTELKKMSGKEFDSMFLTMMIEHHKGAVAMAGTEKEKGSYAPAVSMAGDIISGQTAEITEMNKLLGRK